MPALAREMAILRSDGYAPLRVFSLTNSAINPMEGSGTSSYSGCGIAAKGGRYRTGFQGTDDRVAVRVHAASEPIAVTVHAAGGVPTSQPTHVACTSATTDGTRRDTMISLRTA